MPTAVSAFQLVAYCCFVELISVGNNEMFGVALAIRCLQRHHLFPLEDFPYQHLMTVLDDWLKTLGLLK
jgi:hypothetical protein